MATGVFATDFIHFVFASSSAGRRWGSGHKQPIEGKKERELLH